MDVWQLRKTCHLFFVFLAQIVDYDLEQLGFPFKKLKNEPFKPVIDL